MVHKEDHGARRLGEMTALGSSIIFLSLAIAFLAVGSGSMTLFLAAGYVLIYAVTAAIRLAHFKERPKKRTYGNIFEKLDAASFPSIHAQRASFLALALSSYFANVGLSVLFFGLASGTCYSRIALRKHHVSDVVAGAAIGIVLYYALAASL